MADKSGIGALSSLTLWGDPDKMTPLQPSGSEVKLCQGMISEYTFISRTLLAISCVY
jgi:hypothetical protein